MVPPKASVPTVRARKNSSKQPIDAKGAIRHWAALSVDARNHLLRFRDGQLVDCTFAIQEGLKALEQDCMQKGITFKNTEGQTVLSLGLASFGFSPEGCGQPGQPAPDAFFAHGPLISKNDDEFVAYMEYRLGGFLSGCRPVLRSELWSNLFDPPPHSWMDFECQALRLVEQAILRSYLDAAAAAAAAEVNSLAATVGKEDLEALADELSELPAAPASSGKKSRRKAARRKVRLAANAACEDEVEEQEAATLGRNNMEEPVLLVGEPTTPASLLSERATLDDCNDDDSAAASGERETWSMASSRALRKKERKKQAAFSNHKRSASESSALTDTACGSSCGVKSCFSECVSEISEGIDDLDVVLSSRELGLEACNGSDVDKVVPAAPVSPLPNSWIRRSDLLEWHLCDSGNKGDDSRLIPDSYRLAAADLPDTSGRLRAIVKNTFIELENATSTTKSRSRAFSADL